MLAHERFGLRGIGFDVRTRIHDRGFHRPAEQAAGAVQLFDHHHQQLLQRPLAGGQRARQRMQDADLDGAVVEIGEIAAHRSGQGLRAGDQIVGGREHRVAGKRHVGDHGADAGQRIAYRGRDLARLAADEVELPDLLFHEAGDAMVDLAHGGDATADRADGLAGVLHRLLDAVHLSADFAGGLRGAAGKLLHLGRYHREAAARFAGARRFDGGVERQQRGLPGDGVDQLDDFLDAPGSEPENTHGLVGARQLAGRPLTRRACFIHLPAGIDRQRLHVDRRRRHGGHVLGRLLGGLRRQRHLLRHQPVAFGEIGGGAADTFAGGGEFIDDIVDAAPEVAGEEGAAGMMQPRFGFAPALVDGERIGLNQCAADHLCGLAELAQRAVAEMAGQAEIAVAAGDLADGGGHGRQPPFGERADHRGADNAHGQRHDHRMRQLQREHHRRADKEGRHRNPQSWTRKITAAFWGHRLLTEKFRNAKSPELGCQNLYSVARNRIN